MSNPRVNENERLLSIYDLLDAHFGDLRWWPGDSPFEVIVGAILTQNTAWRNVEIAIDNLKSKDVLSPEAILATEDGVLAELIRSSGYYHVKTGRLKSFVRYLYEEYGGNLEGMFSQNLRTLREGLLTVRGIGEETADSILLYGGGKPIFVIDAYTRRILERHDIIRADATYTDIQNLFMNHIPQSVPLYNQYHALLVNTGKHFCRKTPRCHECPLRMLF
ncbi:MAG: endonuclease III domain-containing protein [Deltaproteobacteria bacterium]|nr:endonuclease III domain-containing protein [Deltaproteobacteria bacterium]